MSVEIDRPVLTEHARKVGLDDVKVPLEDRPEAGRPGWIDMDVRWIVTRDTVGSEDSVFGLTYFPPGSRQRSTVTRTPRRSSTSSPARASPGSGDDDVAMGVGDTVFVARNEYHGFRNTSETETAVMVWYYAGAASLEEATYITEESDRRS